MIGKLWDKVEKNALRRKRRRGFLLRLRQRNRAF